MYGSWLINFTSALVGFFFYFILSVFHKSILQASIEALIAGILFFLLSYFFRWSLSSFQKDLKTDSSSSNGEIVITELASSEPFGKKEQEPPEVEKVTDFIKELLKD